MICRYEAEELIGYYEGIQKSESLRKSYLGGRKLNLKKITRRMKNTIRKDIDLMKRIMNLDLSTSVIMEVDLIEFSFVIQKKHKDSY